MRRTSFLFSLIALAASLFFSGAALAHGGKAHGHGAHHAAAAPGVAGTAGHVVTADDGAGERALFAAHAHHPNGSDCSGAGSDCCSPDCCAPAGLRVEPSGALPARVFTRFAIASEGPPPDAAREALLRPPCR